MMDTPDSLTIALAQLDPLVGDLAGNANRVLTARAQAETRKADLVVFSELFLVGYPPEDLVLKPAFQKEVERVLAALTAETAKPGPALLVGVPWREDGRLYNAMALLEGGEVKAVSYKHHLPNYGVFDEVRLFQPGPLPGPIEFRGVRLGVMVCEDMWHGDVAECLQETGAEILIVPNGSPFTVQKADERMMHATARVSETRLPLIYVNQLGGQDEVVFDGAGFVLDADCTLRVQMPAWQSCVQITHWSRSEDGWRCRTDDRQVIEEGTEAIYLAAMWGLRDYVEKNRFPGVVLGFSGGIDSALTGAIAVDALGPSRVHCVMMPSRYTSQDSLDDAAACAKLLGVPYDIINIRPAVDAFSAMLSDVFKGTEPDTTEENIQSRTRGLILMALSNKFGNMVLATGNKSEMSVGYATLYGDMCGGYNVLKDIYKTQVFELARWRNTHRPKGAQGPGGRLIPEHIITKPPTAELKADQKDEDTLPPYDILDDILISLVDREMSVEEIVARGHDPQTVKHIEHMLYIAEYKRHQAAPGVKVSIKNFGRDRRYPITNGFRDAR